MNPDSGELFNYRARVTRVVDGDTLDCDIDLGLNVHIRERIRLYGVDTPETRGADKVRGLEVAEQVSRLLASVEWVTVRTIKDRTGKYGRYLAEVEIPGGVILNDWLIDNGYAESFL